jgi:NAD(P)-dependent dehydrogenase (short-subunit alcohol dehydrogenase family)
MRGLFMVPAIDSLASGRVALITGATAGIGRQAARELATQGFTVVIVGRDAARGEAVVADLVRGSGNDRVSFERAEAASQQSIRDLAATVATRHERLDVLMNNVAGLYVQRELTVDGIEATFAVTHLAGYLLTRLLLPVLQQTPGARVVNVTSGTYRAAKLDFADMQREHGYRGFDQYQRAKLAMVLCSRELARRTPGVGVFVADPFGADTGSFAQSMAPGMMGPAMRLSSVVFAQVLRVRPGSVERAARSLVRAATDPALDGRSDSYVTAKKAGGFLKAARDQRAMKAIWNLSADLTGLPAS